MKILLILGLICLSAGDEELFIIEPQPVPVPVPVPQPQPQPQPQPHPQPHPYPQPPECNCTLINHDEDTTDPALSFPTTSFTCWGRYDGYYADVEVDCTIFHYCQTWQFPSGLNETVKWDFACPHSTVFNQKILSCTPPNNSFDCKESPLFYWVNYNFSSTATTTYAPEPQYPSSDSQTGQQIIIGGLEPQQLQESTYSPIPVESYPESLDNHPESNQPTYQEPNQVSKPESESVNFPDQTYV